MSHLARPCLNHPRRLIRSGTYCEECLKANERARGTTVERFGRGWNRISREVIERDNGICHVCGQPGADTVDHLHRRRDGGGQDRQLLAAAHRSCNSARG